MEYRVFEGYKVFGDGKIVNKSGKVMSPTDNGRGYLIISLTIHGKRKVFGVHRIVAKCYIENPHNFPEVNHIDGNKLNNSITNLEWTTRSDNIKHAYEHKLRSALGEDNARCNTSIEIVNEICILLVGGKSSSEIRDLGYNYNLVRAIKSKKNWSHISSKYEI